MYKLNTLQILRIGIILLFIPLMLVSIKSLGQTNLTDGEIIYSIQVTSPGALSQQALKILEGGQLIYNFKNNLFRSEMHIGQTDHVNVHNSKDNSGFSLIKGGKDQNYLVEMHPEDFEKEAEKFKGLTFTPQKETKTIAGYPCQKTTGKSDGGNAFSVFYTKKLLPPYNNYDPRFKGLDGIPLQFEIYIPKSKATLTMTATKVNLDFQPSTLFKMPTAGFRVLTYQELQNLRGGK